MAANAPSLPAKAFPVISIREASKKDSEQHLLCAALAREILERAGEHNGNNLRPPASIATKILAARAVRPDLSAQEAFAVFDPCENDCGPNPRDIVRTDRTLQSIVDKIFPQFVKPSAPAPAPAADAEHKASPEEISFSLHEIEGSSRGHGKLDKPYLRTKALLTVAHLKKYLGRKTGLPAEVPIDIFCRDAPLENGLTLEQIVRTLWGDEDNDLVLYYRVL
ncbi:hypothetical protein Ctob_007904 [Chrysochromulina tobinii]|uniref:RAWUL domain-containing protein n=1 Tax=Chrysochromulina tobinii TaxID=1460289 RepID=A0A0M0JY34_9EUKA|nr:hypothetical protein Ctob_007904 [Chrysochromulina tobinii]|eukprot:KOO31464.1 hypothetical protein Ctob_007904 [Chrysochromulina sp. CCMP291]